MKFLWKSRKSRFSGNWGFGQKIKKKFCKKFWPRPKVPFFILGGLKTLANSRLRGTVRTAENTKKWLFWKKFRHPRIWINNTGSLSGISQDACVKKNQVWEKNFRAKNSPHVPQKTKRLFCGDFSLFGSILVELRYGRVLIFPSCWKKYSHKKFFFAVFSAFFEKKWKKGKKGRNYPALKNIKNLPPYAVFMLRGEGIPGN
jgi:hypothetical protein